MPILVTCQCGQCFRAKDDLAGMRVTCPNCGQPLVIPAPLAEMVPVDDLSLDDLVQMDAAAPAQGMPAGMPEEFPQNDGGSDQPGAAGAGFQSPAGSFFGQPAAAPAKSSSSNNRVRIAFFTLGGFGLLAVAGIVLIVVNREDPKNNGSNVATGPSPDVKTTDGPDAKSPNTDPIEEPKTTKKKTPPAGSPAKIPKSPGGKQPNTKLALRSTMLQLHRRAQGLSGLRYHALTSYNQPPFSYSWMTELLPYLGEKKLYEKFDFKKSWRQDPNRKLAQTIIPQFLNPGDPRKKVQEFSSERGLAVTHFVGMSGIEDRRNVVAAQLPRSDPRAGIFGYDRLARPKEITDGTSQTIMLIGVEMARPWVQGGGSTIRGAREPYFKGPTGSVFGSRGQAGAMVLMADGSARLIPPNIDPSVFRAMCTIHGADTVDLSRYPKKPQFFLNVPPRPKVKKPPKTKPNTPGGVGPNPSDPGGQPPDPAP